MELAARLVGYVRGWADAGRPSPADVRVSAYRAGADLRVARQATVIHKQYTRLVLAWRAGRPGPA